MEYEVGRQTFAITSMDIGHQAGVKGGIVSFEVDDFAKALVRLKATQTKFVLDNYESPVCNFAVIVDPDGNEIMIHKRKS